MDKNGQLTGKQLLALDLMLAGKTDTEVSSELSISRQSIHSWKRTDFHFQAELNARRQELWQANSERLRELVSSAVSVLEQDLIGSDLKLRQAAAVHVLKAVALYGANLEPKGCTEAEDLEYKATTGFDALLRSIAF